MTAYQRRTRVAAPFDRVWDFYSRVEGLEALTPDWMHLRVEWVRGPDGGADPDVLEAGSAIRLSVRPFDVGPRQSWTSHIAERSERDGEAVFRDTMSDGPFPHWVHTHAFHEVEGGTVVDDRVSYELPFGTTGRALGPVAVVGFEPMFRYRHRKTRELLEGDGRGGRNEGGGEGDEDGGGRRGDGADGEHGRGRDGGGSEGGNADVDLDAATDGGVDGDGDVDVDVVDLDHVALRVGDLSAALDFYHGLLGLPTRDRERFDRGEVPYVAVVAGGRHLHLVPTDEGDEDADIEPGRDHVCLLLRSDDTDTREELTDLLDGLREAGVTVEADEPRERYGAYGRDWAAYVRDPDERIVELKMH